MLEIDPANASPYGFWKFVLGTVGLGVLALLINWALQRQEAQLKALEVERLELEQMGRFIDAALAENVGTRERFVHYFATVTRSPELRARWNEYLDDVRKERAAKDAVVSNLEKRVQTLAEKSPEDRMVARELQDLKKQLSEREAN